MGSYFGLVSTEPRSFLSASSVLSFEGFYLVSDAGAEVLFLLLSDPTALSRSFVRAFVSSLVSSFFFGLGASFDFLAG